MLFTVSTVKDTLPHLERFVAGNLAGGIDHLVVLLDAPDAPDQAGPRAWLEEHPHVTCIPTDDEWWAGDRPRQLNVRQRISANLVKSVLADVPDAEWLFHIDADEIVQLDRAVLAQVPPDVVAVQLATLEAAAQLHWPREPNLFKTLLGGDDLTLLHTLGVIERPANGAYFHGHVMGKAGVRPGATAWLTLHQVVDADREALPAFTDDRFRVLHYESYSGEEFARKWLAMLGSGPKAGFRRARDDTASSLRTLVAKGLPADRLEHYLLRIFETTTADDVATLTDLGLLVELDPRAGGHVPEPLPAASSAVIEQRLAELRPESKRRFQGRGEPGAASGSAPRADPAPAADRQTSRGWLRRGR